MPLFPPVNRNEHSMPDKDYFAVSGSYSTTLSATTPSAVCTYTFALPPMSSSPSTRWEIGSESNTGSTWATPSESVTVRCRPDTRWPASHRWRFRSPSARGSPFSAALSANDSMPLSTVSSALSFSPIIFFFPIGLCVTRCVPNEPVSASRNGRKIRHTPCMPSYPTAERCRTRFRYRKYETP